jgi:NADH-quinone oxidoreductase subunit J
MSIVPLIFYIFSFVLLTSGLMVIVLRNPVHCALFLVLGFFASAGLWMLMEAEFLALILILVYVGAVMTLFLFVVMTLNIDAHGTYSSPKRYLPLALLIIALLTALMIYVIAPHQAAFSVPLGTLEHPADYNNTLMLGRVLYTTYVYPFEIAGVLLLVAIIAAISLSLRVHRNRKEQKHSEQIAVKREDRIRLIKFRKDA